MRVKSHGLRRLGDLDARCFCCASSVFLGLCAAAKGQQIFVPPTETYGKPKTVEQAAETQIGTITAPNVQVPTGQRVYPLHWGKVEFFPYLSYLLQYGSDVPERITTSTSTNTTTANTFLNTLTPGVVCTWADSWALDLSLNANFYSNSEFDNYVGYSFAIRNSARTGDWLWNYGASAGYSDGTQLETATQTLQQNYGIFVGGSYSGGSRLSLDVGASTSSQITDQFNSYWTWNTIEWLNYRLTPKTSVGLGLGAGYNFVDPGPDTVYEQLQGRVVWVAGEKLNVQVSGGVQFQQITDGSSGNDVFPLGAVTIAYQVRDGTSLSLNASTSIANSSYYADQINQNANFSLSIQQRLFKHYFLNVSPGYGFTQYLSTTADFQDNGDQSNIFLYAGLSTVFFKKLYTSLFYQLNHSKSTDATLEYDTWQVGIRVNYRY